MDLTSRDIYRHQKKNPLENIHLRFCIELLGVQKQTSNIAVLLELGRLPHLNFGKRNCAKNWERLSLDKCNTWLSYSNSATQDGYTKWKTTYLESMCKLTSGEVASSPLQFCQPFWWYIGLEFPSNYFPQAFILGIWAFAIIPWHTPKTLFSTYQVNLKTSVII